MGRNITKKVLAWLCAACLCVQPVSVLAENNAEDNAQDNSGAISTDIMAEESAEENKADMEEETVADEKDTVLLGAVPYNIEVKGQTVTDANMEDVLGDNTVVFDDTTNTLTLNSANIEVTSGNYGLRIDNESGDALTIELKGDSKINCNGYYGIYASGPVVFKGDGTLDCYGSDYGMLVKGALTIDDSVSITSKCGDIISGDSYGIRANGACVIKGQAQVNAQAGYAPVRSNGLYAYTTLEIGENAKVTATGGKGDNDSYGIRTTNMTISGGTVTATGGTAKYGGSGIYTQTLDISGGNTELKGGEISDGPSYGLMAAKTLTVSGGVLMADGGNGKDSSYGIYAGEDTVLTGGVIEAQSGDGEYTYGIETNSLNMSGGTLNSYAKDALLYSWGINAMNGFNISGGYLTAKGGNAADYSYGLQTSSAANITGGNVSATSGSATNSNGMWAFESVDIKDAEVTVQSEGNGIYVPFGKVNIALGEVKVSDYSPALTGTKITITAPGEKVYGGTETNIDQKLKSAVSDAGEMVIEPLVYSVYVKGGVNDKKVNVPAGKSVNEMYCAKYKVDDMSEILSGTKDGYSFGGFYTDEAFTDGKEYSFDNVVTGDVIVYIKWIKILGNYNVNTVASQGGSVEVSAEKPQEGSKVTITVKAENDYAFESVMITDADGNTVAVTKESDNVYSYIQPASDVVVKAVFKDLSAAPAPDENVPKDEMISQPDGGTESTVQTDENTQTEVQNNTELSPKTGDNSKLFLLLSCSIACVIGFVITLNKHRNKKSVE